MARSRVRASHGVVQVNFDQYSRVLSLVLTAPIGSETGAGSLFLLMKGCCLLLAAASKSLWWHRTTGQGADAEVSAGGVEMN
jgi:hypothetical protein